MLSALFALVYLWCVLNAKIGHPWSLPQKLEGVKVLVRGYVSAVPVEKKHAVKFLLSADRIAGQKVKAKLRLSWYGYHPKLVVGNQYRLLVKLKKPHGFNNPGGFDYQRYLRLHKISCTGYVIKSNKNRLIVRHYLRCSVNYLRQLIADFIRKTLNNSPLGGIIIAITVGVKSYITPNIWRVFRATGTSHLVAISGLHITLISGFIFLILNAFFCRFVCFTARIPAKQYAAIGALVFAGMYALFAGLSLPTQRAIIMISCFTLYLLLNRRIQPWCLLVVALVFVLLINPLGGQTSSFYLSFGAVALLLYCFANRQLVTTKRLYWRFIRPQLVIGVGLAPILLYSFQQLSLCSFFANLIAIPAMELVILPLALLGVACLLVSSNLASWLLLASNKALTLLWLYLQWLASLHWSMWYHSIADPYIVVSMIIAVLFLLAPRGLPGRILGGVFILPLFFISLQPLKPGEVRMTALDVGQGLSVVVQTARHLLVYDTGPRFSDDFDAGEAVIVPYLRQIGTKKINLMVVSHGDDDHSGGAKSIISAISVSAIRTSVPVMFARYHARHCWAGQQWNWDGVDFQFLSPPVKSGFSGNNASCVLKISTGINSILLTGDIQKPTEKYLVKRYKNRMLASILQAPHHGSNSSSTQQFINKVRPKYVIFSTGYKNRFGFPSPRVEKRYKMVHSILLNTAYSGAITFTFFPLKTICYQEVIAKS